MDAAADFARLAAIYPAAKLLEAGGKHFVHLPKLQIATPNGVVVRDALLCPHEHSGYKTRLFLSEAVSSNVANWTQHSLFTRTWTSWSWQHVESNQAWTTILANHLAALR
jgi:hypothetical protein